jgi:hypothetical protein
MIVREVMGSHDLMMTEMLCRLQNRVAAAFPPTRGGAIATSPGLRLARPIAVGLGAQGERGDSHRLVHGGWEGV